MLLILLSMILSTVRERVLLLSILSILPIKNPIILLLLRIYYYNFYYYR